MQERGEAKSKTELLFDDFFGDVKFFHILAEHETSLGIKSGDGLIQNRGDWH